MPTKNKTTSAETEIVESKTTDIVPQNNQVASFDIQTIITHAIDQKIPVDTMERLLTMAKEMQAIKAKQDFNSAMAKFQSECPTIEKKKEVVVNGKVAYKYAPIESIISQVKEVLQRNGFSYSTNMELLENGVKVFVRVTHLSGHSEITEMNVPLGTKTGIMSASQQVAAAQTFAKRYAFLNAFGIMTGDEDNDGANLPTTPVQAQKPPVEAIETTPDYFTPFEARIRDCDTEAGLDLVAGEIREAYKNHKLNNKDLGDLSTISRKRREELNPLN